MTNLSCRNQRNSTNFTRKSFSAKFFTKVYVHFIALIINSEASTGKYYRANYHQIWIRMFIFPDSDKISQKNSHIEKIAKSKLNITTIYVTANQPTSIPDLSLVRAVVQSNIARNQKHTKMAIIDNSNGRVWHKSAYEFQKLRNPKERPVSRTNKWPASNTPDLIRDVQY